MLNLKAFASAAAVTIVIFYAMFLVLAWIAPQSFLFFFSAQFFGADIVSLAPPFSALGFIASLIAIAVIAWLVGYVWAAFYNRFSRS